MASSRPTVISGKNKGDLSSTDQAAASAATSVIAEGTIIEGNFSSTESIRVDGTVLGEIRCEKRLVIGVTGKVEGDVYAAEGVIKGSIKGSMDIKNDLHLEETAIVSGSVKAGTIMVDEGAVFNGDSQMPN